MTFVYHLSNGEIDDVDVSGLSIAMFVDAPQVMSEGGWRVGLFVDEAASPDQAEKLQAVFSGQLGGPPAVFSPLVGEVLGVERGPMEFADDGRLHRVRMDERLDMEIEDYVPPNGTEVACLTGMTITPNPTVTIARAIRARVRAFGHDLSHDGKNGHSAPFSWSA